jgi:hypothetical protein
MNIERAEVLIQDLVASARITAHEANDMWQALCVTPVYEAEGLLRADLGLSDLTVHSDEGEVVDVADWFDMCDGRRVRILVYDAELSGFDRSLTRYGN